MSRIETIRQLANNNSITYSWHAMEQLLNRNITTDIVKMVLQSGDNQLIEVQSRSRTPGKEHANDRLLVYAPTVDDDVIVVSVILDQPSSEIRVITAEHVDENVWERKEGQNPGLVRK